MPLPGRRSKTMTEALFDSSESFDLNEYLQSPPLIRRLYEEKLQVRKTCVYFEQKYTDAENKLKDAENKLKDAEKRLGVLNERDSLGNISAFIQSMLVIVGTILVGIGSSWVTSSSSNQTAGLVFLFVGAILMLAAIAVFFLPRLRGTRANG